jgi:hypothetical protein
MNEVRTRIQVNANHRISGIAPADVPPGEHDVAISVASPRPKRFRLADLPIHDVPWDGSISLRREDLYDDDGR